MLPILNLKQSVILSKIRVDEIVLHKFSTIKAYLEKRISHSTDSVFRN